MVLGPIGKYARGLESGWRLSQIAEDIEALRERRQRERELWPLTLKEAKARVRQLRARTRAIRGGEEREQALFPLTLEQMRAATSQTQARTEAIRGAEEREREIFPRRLQELDQEMQRNRLEIERLEYQKQLRPKEAALLDERIGYLQNLNRQLQESIEWQKETRPLELRERRIRIQEAVTDRDYARERLRQLKQSRDLSASALALANADEAYNLLENRAQFPFASAEEYNEFAESVQQLVPEVKNAIPKVKPGTPPEEINAFLNRFLRPNARQFMVDRILSVLEKPDATEQEKIVSILSLVQNFSSDVQRPLIEKLATMAGMPDFAADLQETTQREFPRVPAAVSDALLNVLAEIYVMPLFTEEGELDPDVDPQEVVESLHAMGTEYGRLLRTVSAAVTGETAARPQLTQYLTEEQINELSGIYESAGEDGLRRSLLDAGLSPAVVEEVLSLVRKRARQPEAAPTLGPLRSGGSLGTFELGGGR